MCLRPDLRNWFFCRVLASFTPQSLHKCLLCRSSAGADCPPAASAGCAQAPLQVCPHPSTPWHYTGMPQLWGSCEEFPLLLPKTPSLFCAFIPYSCDHLGAMLSLSFPDSAGISGSFPLHLLLQKAPGLRSALPPVFVGLSLPPRPLSPLHPLQKSSRVSCHLFLFSPGSCSTVTSDLPALFLRG